MLPILHCTSGCNKTVYCNTISRYMYMYVHVILHLCLHCCTCGCNKTVYCNTISRYMYVHVHVILHLCLHCTCGCNKIVYCNTISRYVHVAVIKQFTVIHVLYRGTMYMYVHVILHLCKAKGNIIMTTEVTKEYMVKSNCSFSSSLFILGAF